MHLSMYRSSAECLPGLGVQADLVGKRELLIVMSSSCSGGEEIKSLCCCEDFSEIILRK